MSSGSDSASIASLTTHHMAWLHTDKMRNFAASLRATRQHDQFNLTLSATRPTKQDLLQSRDITVTVTHWIVFSLLVPHLTGAP